MTVFITVPSQAVEHARREAEKAGMTLEEYIIELLFQSLDPRDRTIGYIEAAQELLREAREELGKGDLRQAAGKLWGTTALTLKAYALAVEGHRLKSHAELWEYKDRVAEEIGSWVRTAFMVADSMHKNFYEGLATRKDVEDALREAEKLVKAVAGKLGYT